MYILIVHRPQIKEKQVTTEPYSIAKAKHGDLCFKLRRWDTAYYSGTPVVTDQVYDAHYRQLLALEEDHPELRTEDSPSVKLTPTEAKGFEKYLHEVPMLSIKTVVKPDEATVAEFIEKTSPAIHKGEKIKYVMEYKYDGLGLSVIYRNGRLTAAATRGDGMVGEDVTHNALAIRNLPRVLIGNYPPYMEVRGEVLMHLSTLAELNAVLQDKGLEPLKNCRNAAAGAMRSLDSSVVLERKLFFVAYGVGGYAGDKPTTQIALLESLRENGFHTFTPTPVSSVREIMATHADFARIRANLDIEIDGAVLKVNSLRGQDKLGFLSKEPRWAVALKYEPQVAITTIEAVDYQVGRTGVLTPVARLSPVECGGTTISNATLHNEQYIRSKDIRVGDTVTVIRAGDVIPRVESVVLDLRKPDSVPFSATPPTHCPSCNEPLTFDETRYICTYSFKCPEQALAMLEHFVARRAMNIEGLGPKTLQKLLEAGVVECWADLHYLDQETLQRVLGFSERQCAKILEAIERSATPALRKLIYALGIKSVGESTAKTLANQFKTVQGLLDASPEVLYRLDDIGPSTGGYIMEALEDPVFRKDLVKLLKRVKPLEVKDITLTNPDSRSFVITGVFDIPREQIVEQLVQKGHRPMSSLSTKTDVLIVGEKPSEAKYGKAGKLAIPIITNYKDLL